MIEVDIHKKIYQTIEAKEKTQEEIIRTIELILYMYHINYYSITTALTLIQKVLQK